MPLRLGPGPVFAYEWLTTSRRWQPYAIRAGFVGLILVGMAIVHSSVAATGPDGGVSLRDLALFGQNLFKVVAWIELTLVLLVAPAVTAGAVCVDKARGTLDHMLTTDLSNAEIVLGKLGARLIPLLILIACTVPVMALAGLLGGIDPMALAGLFQIGIGCAFVGCALAMVLSIYGRKTHEVVMAAYILLIGWFVAPILLEIGIHAMSIPIPPAPPPGAPPIPRPSGGPPPWLTLLHEFCYKAHPYILAFASYDEPTPPGEARYLGFLGGCLAVSAAMVVLATARVRRVAMKQAGRTAAAGRRRWSWAFPRLRLPGPSLDGNPVAWREWHRGRASAMMRIVWVMYAVMGLCWLGLAVWASNRNLSGDHASVGFANTVQVTIGLLLLCVAAASGLAEERARGSLDVLLSTPMPTRSILAGKWWGSYRRVLVVVIWPAAMTALLAARGGYWIGYLLLLGLVLAHGAAITSLGLAMATWVSRPGRAIAACVAVQVLLMIGWPIFLYNILRPGRTIGQPLMAGDPPVGVLFATIATSSSGPGIVVIPGATRVELLLWTAGWIVAFALAAAALFNAACVTFDACLGRIPDDGRASAPSPEVP